MQRSNPKVDKFYHSKAWKDTSKAYMNSKFYICERCNNSATICHHKEYITIDNIDNPNITLKEKATIKSTKVKKNAKK